MTEVNSENLEKVSGGAKNTHSKIRRLGDKPIKRTCICCKESFSVLPWEPRYICNKCQLKTNNLPKVSPKNLEKVSGGVANPVAGMSFEDAKKHAEKLGTNGIDYGSWKTMNTAQFMKWWLSSNENRKEYLDNKAAADLLAK